MNKLLILIGISLITSLSIAKPTLFDIAPIDENAEVKADELFKQNKYNQSFELYSLLAKFGDKYSQYMISVHYLNGLGVEKDLLQAYGWAGLASRGKAKEFKEYFQQVKSKVAKKDLPLAEKTRTELSEQYSDLAVAMKLKRMINNTIPKCAGSRMRGNCGGFIYHYCFDNGSQKSYDRCVREVKLRDPKVINGLRKDLAMTNAYIEQKILDIGSVTVEEVNHSEEESAVTEEK